MAAALDPILLASGSPRRGELLRQMRLNFTTIVPDIDESPLPDEAPPDYVTRLAIAKARAGWSLSGANLPTLGADTAVVLDGEIFGKPQDSDHARAMLSRLSGRRHQVLTAVALIAEEFQAECLSTSDVWLRKIRLIEVDDYWASGEPRGKAGGYAIQGAGAVFVERLAGSYSGVMGLPIFETAELLERLAETRQQSSR